ncbi:MAG: efflux RND transporter periplasmic adaptor subunit [Desulfobacteraceae bacterium]|nr:efflux RND transporter periplasmic adaptor subunit [Desulfobacteraceae bacterium]MDH3573045.1 efflux RND transporter periplasmic adaptor subunit [Desulfobacteraceae bacterium]MDH3722360.1 efflux RND transporter periplasmic adaptor subunit [Desulfobacteraceae bacterium]MDH3837546.1 efflux RND transporter periplasmic adaptor subunit [Desulfobacteraceae bacterium]PLX49970.1 MAG: efflux RND transporter periplasmic adaptor subunit [Desulfobacteraceae bacterium]
MNRRYIRWIVLVLVIAASAVIVWYFTRSKPVEVVVKPVDSGIVERTVANTRAGTVKACRRAKLSPSVGGQIAKLSIREGDTVKEGTLLLEIWNQDLVAQVQLAQSEAEAARARARAACLKAEVSQREANRLVKLYDKKVASEERTDKAVTDAKALSADCKAARASVLMSEASIGVVKANLARTRLIAPFDGVVAEINGELSEFVTPSPIGIATPPVVDLIDNTCFYITAPIDEVDVPKIAPGMTARVSLDAFGDHRFSGKVRRIAPYVLDREKQARTVDVEVEFTMPEDIRKMLAGYSADVEIILDVQQNTLRIPTAAVLDGDRVFVYLPGDKKINARTFKSGISNWYYTEVISGLKPDELVVINVDGAGMKDNATAVISKEE